MLCFQDGGKTNKTTENERRWRMKRASGYVGVQLVSRTIFVVCPADHISNIRESELSGSTQHLAVALIEPLPAKDSSGKQRANDFKCQARFCCVYCVANCVKYLVRHLISHLERLKCKTQRITPKPQLQNR